MRSRLPARLLLALPLLGWSGWFLWSAFGRWRHESICAMVCGPFVPVELADHYRRAFDWQTPLALAGAPLLALALWALAAAVTRKTATRAA